MRAPHAGVVARARSEARPGATGLKYEDCLVETEEVKMALKRLPAELLNAREQRLKRAMVLSSQHKTVRCAAPLASEGAARPRGHVCPPHPPPRAKRPAQPPRAPARTSF